ncbi:DHBP synthase RibB-like alpha/beta domain protein, putative [Medicago truncatula]|uniref:DHBP synthase RibB-like alpha/beta domain protein, putative n=1 Tax=Medicago truncatula TaxID=3880 RepID=A0A072UAQ4_MEDTR|nr:DHBP synthase RibB-like alpha/beta domain protein, putative [Medicago truncatula]
MEMAACICGHKPPWLFDAFSHWKPQSHSHHKSRGGVSMAFKRSPKRLKYTDNTRLNKDGGLIYIEADPFGSDSWKLEPVVNLLKQGAVGVIPTDTLSVLSIYLFSFALL